MALDDRRMRLGDDVLVLDRHHRDVEPDHGAGLTDEVAGGADHVLAGDLALVGGDQPLAGRLLGDRGDGGVAVDLGAAARGHRVASAWVRSAGWM